MQPTRLQAEQEIQQMIDQTLRHPPSDPITQRNLQAFDDAERARREAGLPPKWSTDHFPFPTED